MKVEVVPRKPAVAPPPESAPKPAQRSDSPKPADPAAAALIDSLEAEMARLLGRNPKSDR